MVASGQLRVHSGSSLPPGHTRTNAKIASRNDAAIAPTESIIRFAGVTKLFLVENGKARSINDIITGVEGQGWVEVTSKSLPFSAMVVTTGQTQLADGTPVGVRTPEPPSDRRKKANGSNSGQWPVVSGQ
jgi:hypothetical protein